MSYPYHEWPTLSRAQCSTIRRSVRSLPQIDPRVITRELEILLGTNVSLSRPVLYYWTPSDLPRVLPTTLIGLVVQPSLNMSPPLVIEVSLNLGLSIVERILGGDGGAISAGAMLPSEAECGVLAYVGARLVAALSAPYRVVDVYTTQAPVAELLHRSDSHVWAVEMRLGADVGSVRVWAPTSSNSGKVFTFDGHVEQMPLTMVADGGVTQVASEALQQLNVGDVLLFDELWWSDRHLRVRALGARRTEWRGRFDSNRILLTGIERSLEPALKNVVYSNEGEEVMLDETDRIAMVGDAPVEVSLELVRFRTTVEELAQMRVGEVLLSGVAIGGRVRLRVSDALIAEGELVNVDGEVGVRVLSLAE